MQSRFADGEFYHIYNRGVDKRVTFLDTQDFHRFIMSMVVFNTLKPVGSLFEYNISMKLKRRPEKSEQQLVDIVSYALNSNHFHLLLGQKDGGSISEFMKRLSSGYTQYFNRRYRRSGVLFQGKFKSIHVDSNEYLLRLSSYINLNFRVHRLGFRKAKSSWEEYIGKEEKKLCDKDIILEQFSGIKEYKEFAEEALEDILSNKEKRKEIEGILFE